MTENSTEIVKGSILEAVSDKAVFLETLQRNNAKIKQDRARTIAEDTQLEFRRFVEDTEIRIKKLMRSKENMLDVSPTNATSLIVASDFDSKAFVQKTVEMGVEIANTQRVLDVARKEYEYLFGTDKE